MTGQVVVRGQKNDVAACRAPVLPGDCQLMESRLPNEYDGVGRRLCTGSTWHRDGTWPEPLAPGCGMSLIKTDDTGAMALTSGGPDTQPALLRVDPRTGDVRRTELGPQYSGFSSSLPTSDVHLAGDLVLVFPIYSGDNPYPVIALTIPE
jgi:hypothetical protein